MQRNHEWWHLPEAAEKVICNLICSHHALETVFRVPTDEDALEHLDEKGRRAVEFYLNADARAHRAEWLIELLQAGASQRGPFFELKDASGH